MREKERLMLDERKKQEHLERQKSARERTKIIEENKKEFETQKRRDYEDINKILGEKNLIKKSDLDEQNKKTWHIK